MTTIQSTNFGEKIGKYTAYQRKKLNLSLNKLAQLSGLTPSFLMRLEQGFYHSLKLDVTEKLAGGFMMNLEDFLRKCTIISDDTDASSMPTLEFFLKETYQLPPQAIEDVVSYIEFIKARYSADINRITAMKKAYWKKLNEGKKIAS